MDVDSELDLRLVQYLMEHELSGAAVAAVPHA
jgi:hypothetical protein